MALVIVCGTLLAAGIAVAVVWRAEPLRRPDPSLLDRAGGSAWGRRREALRHYAWWAGLLTLTGTATGLLVTGAGGRLAMRLLALTSPASTGRLTEGQAVIGQVSLEGTVTFLIFGALPLAFASSALFLLVAPWLPRGPLAGPAFGVVLLVALSPFVDPLRPDNRDFDVLGPGWLSVLVFSAMAILQGAAIAAVAGRLSRALPLARGGTVLPAVAPLALAAALVPVGVVLAAGAVVVAAVPRALPWVLAIRESRRGVTVGRIALAALVLATTPAFIGAVLSIAGR